MKADKSQEAPEVDALLVALGNNAKAIPYYAMFQPEKEPAHFNGVFITANSFLSRLAKEGVELKEEAQPTVASKSQVALTQ